MVAVLVAVDVVAVFIAMGLPFDECSLARSKVMTIFGLRDIDKIKSGDLVLTFNEEKGYNEYKRVIKLITHINFIKDCILTLDDNSNLRVAQT